LIVSEEVTKFAEYGHSMTLVRMRQCVEYLLGCMDEIGDNDDLGNIFLGIGLVDAIPNHKNFGFSGHDKDYMV